MGTHLAGPQPPFLRALPSQLLQQRLPPGGLRFLPLQATARLVAQLQPLTATTEPFLPGCGQRLQANQGAAATSMQPRADQGHLLIEGVEQ